MRIATIAVAALMWAGPMGAQHAATMQRGLTSLETSVAGTFRRYGVDVYPRSLTLSQIARVLQLGSSRCEGDPELSRSCIKAILRTRRSFSPGDQ